MEQPYYNLLSREVVEKEYAELYPRIGTTVFSPLAGALLTTIAETRQSAAARHRSDVCLPQER